MVRQISTAAFISAFIVIEVGHSFGFGREFTVFEPAGRAQPAAGRDGPIALQTSPDRLFHSGFSLVSC